MKVNNGIRVEQTPVQEIETGTPLESGGQGAETETPLGGRESGEDRVTGPVSRPTTAPRPTTTWPSYVAPPLGTGSPKPAPSPSRLAPTGLTSSALSRGSFPRIPAPVAVPPVSPPTPPPALPPGAQSAPPPPSGSPVEVVPPEPSEPELPPTTTPAVEASPVESVPEPLDGPPPTWEPPPPVLPGSTRSRPPVGVSGLLTWGVWLIPLVALITMGLQVWWWSDNPDDKEWAQAGTWVADNWREGDILRVEPGWATGALTHFAGLVHDRRGKLEPRELHRYERLWVIGHLDQKHPDLPGEAFTFEETMDFNRIQVHRYLITGVGNRLFDGLEQLRKAQVVRMAHPEKPDPPRAPGKGAGAGRKGPAPVPEERCTLFVSGEWHCGKVHPWQSVKPVRFNVDYAPRYAIWAHPLDGNRKLKITWPAVPIGDTIEFQMGWTTSSSQHHHKGAPVEVEVWVGEELIHRDVLPTGTGEWRVREIDVSKWTGQQVPVSVINRTADFSSRQLLFNIRSWQGRPSW